jgi:hypothetical protein
MEKSRVAAAGPHYAGDSSRGLLDEHGENDLWWSW